MVLKKWNGEQVLDPDINGTFEATLRSNGRNLVRQLQDRAVSLSDDGGEFAEAYVDVNGRLDTVRTAITDTTALFDTNMYSTNDRISGEYPLIMVEADSLSAGWAQNDCETRKMSAGRWAVYCTTGDYETRRAQVYKSLFYGTTGADALILDFTAVTAIKSNVSRDIGKRAAYKYVNSNTTNGTATSTGTFTDTTTNISCSAWSDITSVSANSYHPDGRFEFEVGNVVNSISAGNPETVPGESLELGTDTTDESIDNPADTYVYSRNSAVGNYGSAVNALFLTTSPITWVDAGNAGGVWTEIDYFVDHSIPLITDGTSESFDSIIMHDINEGDTMTGMSNGFLAPLTSLWEDGANIQYKFGVKNYPTGPWLSATYAINSGTYTDTDTGAGRYAFHITADGLKMFVLSYNNTKVYQHSLATAWDITTASYDGLEYTVTNAVNPRGMAMSADGTRMFVLSFSNDAVVQYNLSTPWLITSATYDSQLSVNVNEDSPYGMTVSSDGLRMFISGGEKDGIISYTMSVAWDVSTAVGDGGKLLLTGPLSTAPGGLFISTDGSYIAFSQTGSGYIGLYNLTTPYDLNTGVYLGSTGITGTPYFNPDGDRLFVYQGTSIATQYDSWDGSFSEETSYIDANSVQSFVPLVEKADTFTVKLIPKSTTPTDRYPSVYGVAYYE